MPIYPLYPILFEQNGLSVAQISLLLVIWSIPVVILEIPSGILSDRWSRKYMMVIGNVLQAACYGVWLAADSFAGFAAGFLLWGISCAFSSGAGEALLFESLKIKGCMLEFDIVYGRGNFCSGVSIAAACLGGGFIAMQFGIDYTLIISLCSGLVAAGIALSFREVNLYKHENANTHTISVMIADIVSLFNRKHTLAAAAIMSVVVISTSDILDEYDSLIVNDFGLSLRVVGAWVSLHGVFTAAGGIAAPYVNRFLSRTLHIQSVIKRIGVVGAAASLCVGAAGVLQKTSSLFFYAVFYLLMAVCAVITEDYIQQNIETEGRATVHSVVNMMFNIFGILFYGVLGIVFHFGNLFSGLVFVAVYVITAVGLFFFFDCKREREEKLQ